MSTPAGIIGMHHLALKVKDLEVCERFYTEIIGFTVEWKPDADNVYLTTGADNLALHRSNNIAAAGALDHFGMVVRTMQDVDLWHDHLVQHNVTIKVPPRTHRDGARSFYCYDPEENLVQIIYHPPLSDR